MGCILRVWAAVRVRKWLYSQRADGRPAVVEQIGRPSAGDVPFRKLSPRASRARVAVGWWTVPPSHHPSEPAP